MSAIPIPFSVFVVKTDPTAARHHGMHTNASPHVLTPHPKEGDLIVAVFSGEKWIDFTPDGRRLVGVNVRGEGIVHRHAGRSASLGEDGLEDAYGGDALRDLIPEIVSGECGWNYAPVEYVGGEDADVYDQSWTMRGEKLVAG